MKIRILSSFTMIFPMIQERYVKILIILHILAKKIYFHPFFVKLMQNQSNYTLLYTVAQERYGLRVKSTT